MIFQNILLAYQLENYYNLRFLKFIYTHPRFWIQGSKRQVLDYTPKAKLILFLSIMMFVLDIALMVYLSLGNIFWIVWIIISLILLPLYYVIASILISPLDRYLKKRIIRQAKAKLTKFPHLKIVAITWSYGKTTTKEILHTILSESFDVLSTEGTKNTPLGISRLILSQLKDHHKILIVEMWAYTKWNIAELCTIAKPDISIITGITLQHLERFWSLDEIIDTKFEILECLEPHDLAILDTSTEGVQRWLREKTFQLKNIITVQKELPLRYLENLRGIEFELEWEKIHTKFLADYIWNTLQICYEVSKQLWQDIEDFRRWVQKIDFVEHRMQLIHNPQSDVYVLDDSFNGNLQGIESIIRLLREAPLERRKIVVAGWVVELWEKTYEINSVIWRKLASVSDLVLIIEWPVWDAIEAGLQDAGYKNIKKFRSALELHSELKNIILPWDFVIFQNDLPDNYL